MIPTTEHQEIRRELSMILESRYFKHAPILSRFLKFVVESTLNGEGHLVKEYTVGRVILEKVEKFDQKLNASVRIHAIRLRKLLADYYLHATGDVKLRIDIPKGSYQPVFIPISQYDSLRSGKADLSVNDKEDSICILPFTGFIHHSSVNFSIVGFCEFLSEKLSLFQDIKVVSFHSSSRFIEEGGSLETIGKVLGVSYFLTGSIELDNDQLRVSFQLFEAESNEFIWSQQSEVSLLSSAVMEAADHISNQIVASLAGYAGVIHYRQVLDIKREPALTNKRANAIFWFYHYQVHHTKPLFYEAIQKLEKVVAEDENCALCLAVLAHLYADALIYNYQTDKNPLETAQACVTKALQIDDHCQHAHLVQGWIHILTRNKQGLINSVEKIDVLNPNSSMFKAMCSLGLSFVGAHTESLAYLKKAKQLNPLPYWWMNLPELFVALKNDEYEKVIFLARKSSTPKVIYEHVFEMIGLYYMGNLSTLQKVLQVYNQKYPNGIEFVEKALPAIILDDELAEKIRKALHEIGKIENANSGN